ncbi:hypothetical protein CHUAL_005448 [Chamberlinius hualienensis]
MLFNPNFVDEALGKPVSPDQQSSLSLSSSYKMFSPTSPSPTRTMIKEANDHLQLLHQRVMELEKTVQEQAEALMKKDELMQQKLGELSEMKDAVIADLKQTVTTYDQRVKKLEQQCRESNHLLEMLNQKYLNVEELDVYIPTLEKLLLSMRKLTVNSKRNSNATSLTNCVQSNSSANLVPARSSGSVHGSGSSGGSRSRKIFKGSPNRMNNDRGHHSAHRDSLKSSDVPGSVVAAGVIPEKPQTGSSGVTNSMGQLTVADLKMGRSFKITSNFSMSDEDDSYKYSTFDA